MGDRKRVILQAIGYALFFVLFFVWFLYRGFPYNAIKDRLLEQLGENTGFRVEILAFSPYWLSGFKAQDVRIYHEAAAGSQMIAKLDAVKLRAGLLGLLRGVANVSLDVDLYGGNVEGDVSAADGRLGLDLTLAGIDLSQYDLDPFLQKYGQFRIGGVLDGTLALDYDEADARAATGKLALGLQSLSLSETKVYGMDLPGLAFQPAELELDLSERVLRVAKGDLVGDNMDASLGGRMNVNDKLDRSNLNFTLKFKPKGELDKQFGSVLSAVRKKDRDGFYRLTVSGTLSKPRVR